MSWVYCPRNFTKLVGWVELAKPSISRAHTTADAGFRTSIQPTGFGPSREDGPRERVGMVRPRSAGTRYMGPGRARDSVEPAAHAPRLAQRRGSESPGSPSSRAGWTPAVLPSRRIKALRRNRRSRCLAIVDADMSFIRIRGSAPLPSLHPSAPNLFHHAASECCRASSGLRLRRIPPQHLLAVAAEGRQALNELIGHQTQPAGGPGGGAIDE